MALSILSKTFPITGGKSYVGTTRPAAGRPAWRTAMAPNTWAAVPGNTLAAIDPENKPAINPNYPSNSPWKGIGGQSTMITAWGGAAWDEATATMWLPLQGGHGDYGGNEPYKNCLNADSPAWSMVRNPSGAVGNVLVCNDGNEASGVYSDGRLRSIHSYNNNIYVPGIGPVMTRQSGVFSSGQTGANKAYKLNESTGEATLLCDYNGLAQLGPSYGGATYDSLRNCIYQIGVTNTALAKLDISTGVGTRLFAGDNYIDGYAKLLHIAEYDLILVIHGGGTGYPPAFYMFDPTTGYAKVVPTVTGSFSAGFALSGSVGAEWDAANHRVLLWNNTTNRTEISTLSPVGNPRTAAWQAGVLSVGGSNTVTPTGRSTWGTWGRFGYSAKLGGCYLLNATNEPVYFFATE